MGSCGGTVSSSAPSPPGEALWLLLMRGDRGVVRVPPRGRPELLLLTPQFSRERRSPRRVAGCGGDDSEMEGSGGTRLLAAAAEGAVAVDAAAGSVNGGGEVRLAAVPGGALGASDGVGNGPARSK